jgi:hypothetical protein
MVPEPVCAACGRAVRETGVLLSPSGRVVHATCWPGGGGRILTGPPSPGQAIHPESNEATERLLAELGATPTDLAQLLRRAIRKHAAVLVVSSDAVRGWETRAGDAWAKTQDWLDVHGMRLVVLETEPSGDEPWRHVSAGGMRGPLG